MDMVLLIPVLRALFSPRDAVYILLSSIRDVGIALLLIGYSALKWRGARYRLHNGITLEQGILFQRGLRVVAEDAASVEVERSPLMWLFGGRRVRVNTAGLRRRADATPVSAGQNGQGAAGRGRPAERRKRLSTLPVSCR